MILLGVFIVLEASVSLYWPHNDKSAFAQAIRCVRIIIGILIVVLSI